MQIFDWDADLSELEREILVESIAASIEKRGLQVPAVLLLEMHRPFHFLLGSGVVAASGVLVPFFGAKRVQQASKLLESKQGLEMLIARIEQNHTAAVKGGE